MPNDMFPEHDRCVYARMCVIYWSDLARLEVKLVWKYNREVKCGNRRSLRAHAEHELLGLN